MILYLIKPEQYFSTVLPERVEGRYWVRDFDALGNERRLLSVEAVDGKWFVQSNKTAVVLDGSGVEVRKMELTEKSFFLVDIDGNHNSAVIYTEPISNGRSCYSKYRISGKQSIRIGRDDTNEIVYANPFITSSHAILRYDGTWHITDKDSSNGTFVNEMRTDSRDLKFGDCIFIMGLRIVVGKGFLAINNPDSSVQVKIPSAEKYLPQEIRSRVREESVREEEFFFRSPRLMRENVIKKIKIDPPPAPQKADTTPIGLVIGPSLTMGMASVSMGVFSVLNVMSGGGKMIQALPMIIMSGSMLLGSVLWPMLSRRFENNKTRKLEAKRQQRYLDYLEQIQDDIRRIVAEQGKKRYEDITKWEECAERIIKKKTNLWERQEEHPDFLQVRVGVGDLPLDIDISCEEKKFSLEDDNLQNAMLAVGTEQKMLRDVPISVSLREKDKLGVVGQVHMRVNFLKSIILQLVALHSYDEMKLVLLCDEKMMEEFSFIKYIPHVWNADRSFRYLAAEEQEARELSAELERLLFPAEEEAKRAEDRAYFILISASRRMTEACKVYKRVLALPQSNRTSILSVENELKDLPKETKTVIELAEQGKKSSIYDRKDMAGSRTGFLCETATGVDTGSVLQAAGEALANISIELESQKYVLPSMITFLEMFQVSKIEHLNPLARWKENNPVQSLQAPVGMGTDGKLFMLDLHEKYHGPHGLVAGMTGSGKSEFIITYILSLAVNYHPDEVAFILIDYKGGGLAGAFADAERGIKLPHLAGTITNLDGAEVNRSLISIQSELKRRQAVFNKAKKVANEGTMDIYKYQQLYRDGIVSEPVPHLFIISDEFAELKAQQSDFMQQLISAARIGRSLGVHLILATQKPSGVVDDQIWSNSRFRVCLKVQERSDSQDMIQCPDAAEISQTGRFYLQVGYNELFAMGQSAWCGAEYIPTETLEKTVDDSIQVVNRLGQPIVQIKPEPVQAEEEEVHHVQQVVGIVQYLSELADKEGIQVRSLWKPRIPAFIYLGKVEKQFGYQADENNIEPMVGIYDDPYNQRQGPVTISLSKDGNCVLYGAGGSGKEEFLMTLCYSLIKHYTADILNLYIVDFGSETLRALEGAPHVGGVVLLGEDEKLASLFKLLSREINKRKKAFAEYGGTYDSYVRYAGKRIPHIVVVINNVGILKEQFEKEEEQFSRLSQMGMKYGLYFVVTAATTNALSYITIQNFKMVLTMQLHDKSDYPVIMGKTEGLCPSAHVGRGLVRYDRLYEFQTAYCTDAEDRLGYIREFCKNLRKQKSDVSAPLIPVLPDVVDADYVMQTPYGFESLPVGVGKAEFDIRRIDMVSSYIYPVGTKDMEIGKKFARQLVKVLQNLADVEIWDEMTENVKEKFLVCEQCVNDRFRAWDKSGNKTDALRNEREKVWIIIGLQNLTEQLSDNEKIMLDDLFEHGKSQYKGHFILVDTDNAFRDFRHKRWYQNHILGTDGIWLGDSVADQSVFTRSGMLNEYFEAIGHLEGWHFVKGKMTRFRVLSEEAEGDE